MVLRAATTLLAAAASLVAACSTSAPTVEPADSRPAGAWERTAAVEDANRQALTALTVGDEVVIVAGSTGAAERLTALAYDPAADRWRQVRPSPLRWRVGYAAVSTGEELLVWGGVGNGGGAATGAAYDPASDTWRRLAQAPLSGRAFHSAVWTGAELLVWGGAAPGLDGERAERGSAYDPAAGRWRPLPEAPLAGRYRHAAAWTGEAMVIVGGSDDAESEGTRGAPQRFLADAAAYDPTADVWRLLPPAPFDPVSPPSAVWTGREVIVWDGSSGAAYNPASDAWRPLAERPSRRARASRPSGTAGACWFGAASRPVRRLSARRWRRL